MNWLDKLLPPQIKQSDAKRRKSIPEGLWLKCPECEAVLYRADVEANLHVCPKCDHHMPIGVRERLDRLLDVEGRYEIGQGVLPVDPLRFMDRRKYSERLSEAMEDTGETDAMVVIGGAIHSIPVVVACFDFSFIGGSMGSVVGERFVRGVQNAIEQRSPFICIAASGGARMQENVYSLMQMAKTTAILTRLTDAGLPFISVLTHPTTGGVSASFAFLGDVVIAEPKAEIAFTGKTIIKQVVGETLPDGYQRPEFLIQRGALDMIVDRRQMREKIAHLAALLTLQPADSVA
ncbi:acetyl-CoA carboxylase, carboxyltransferase subunit beta [Paraburkholderia terricola]|jgi:acetyl-CoA carboxylase carboxyl transferase subunit beta|uniref:Acetyl-coenzyme A carboxylase carboxyl transferase subunit beta n=1 Tax=Paraburkholderia terricola TaxID=169427 RepID=A0ABU1M2A0_9BURK|nr:acetyl-CoA carboxylase, carboxyltransferase subunit beta [Paraburkholderia terricola]MDR6413153.1 acetyl-CoA carboxylase carboxyl transferase subunit beta [Paraburkholderia terricola]MDR6449628.1 acetyl-CoA carboxylase carboxyl transferase subunit beta [Paraburkholderia terricola]MDR6485333.1 acetyl-CoA carboxylase carboxyl transferase subunit beta [Paraburkholderia terricola]